MFCKASEISLPKKVILINLSKILLTFMFSWNNPSIQITIKVQQNSDSPLKDQSALIMIHYDQQFMIEKRRFRNQSLLSDGSISRPCIFSVSQNLLRQCIASVSQKIFCRDLWNVKLDGVPQRPPPTGGQFGPLGFRINSTSTFFIFAGLMYPELPQDMG